MTILYKNNSFCNNKRLLLIFKNYSVYSDIPTYYEYLPTLYVSCITLDSDALTYNMCFTESKICFA